MPTLSFFYGIKITMYWDDHPPPHFHATYGSDIAAFMIRDLRLLEGKFPNQQMRLVLQWAQLHQTELLEAWTRCQTQQPPLRISPLP